MRLTRLCATALAALALASPTPASASTSQFGCSFDPPKPQFHAGRAHFRVEAACIRTRHVRRIEVALVGDDLLYDDVIRKRLAPVPPDRRTVSLAVKSWPCTEDLFGRDEVYVQIRVEERRDGIREHGTWVRGPMARHRCR